jgi:rod shape-determining protein MreD
MIALRLAGLAIGLLLLQRVAVELLPPSVRPDLVLVFAAAMGLRRSRGVAGLLLAFGLGFAFDVLSGAPLGLYAWLRGTACAATRALDRALYLRAPFPWALYCAAYALVDWLLLAAALHLLAPQAAPSWSELLARAPGAAGLTGVCAGLLLGAFRRSDLEGDRDASWSVASSSIGHRVRP